MQKTQHNAPFHPKPPLRDHSYSSATTVKLVEEATIRISSPLFIFVGITVIFLRLSIVNLLYFENIINILKNQICSFRKSIDIFLILTTRTYLLIY